MQDWILFAICMAALAVSVLAVAILFPPSSRRGSYPPAIDVEMAVEVQTTTITTTTPSPLHHGLAAPSVASSPPAYHPTTGSSAASSPTSDDAPTLVDGRESNFVFPTMTQHLALPPTATSRPSMMPPTGARSGFETRRDAMMAQERAWAMSSL